MEKQDQPKGPTIDTLKQKWKIFSASYSYYDTCPQTFFYTLCNMLKLDSAKNILQVACGAGRLLPYALQLKNPGANYYGTDLTKEMIDLANERLKSNFERYESKLTFEQWVKKQKLHLQTADVQQQYEKGVKFDRIIGNLVFMTIPDPQKAFTSLAKVAQDGCLFGLTIWGNPEKNNLLNVVGQCLKQANIDPPVKMRSNFHLYNNVDKLLNKCGWQVVANWQQNAPYPILSLDESNQLQNDFLYSSFNGFSAEEKQKLIPIAKQKYRKSIQSKEGLHFYTQMLIVRKK